MKNALSIALAVRNFLFSRSSSLILALSVLLQPDRSPASRSAWIHHSRSVVREHPSFSMIKAHAALLLKQLGLFSLNS